MKGDALKLLGFAAVLAAAPAQAEPRTFTPPPGCTAFLTVQSLACTVDQYWTCATDPEGVFWRMTMNSDGPGALAMSDQEYRWLETESFVGGTQEYLVTPETDPQSMSELLSNGVDSWTFEQRLFFEGREFGLRQVQGFDRLTGEEAVIDGETLLVSQYDITERDAPSGERSHASGSEYVLPRFNLFLGGTGIYESGVDQFEFDATPVTIREPGEPGFLDPTPQYGCNSAVTSIRPDVLPAALTMIPSQGEIQ